ncbi:MAG: cell division FtsZ family protein [Deltaproteobacteria bacterium]|jgi:cell division protein FtsZ|nr:cell division FtsZ family protein [Deltaproteobacteria bacterium]
MDNEDIQSGLLGQPGSELEFIDEPPSFEIHHKISVMGLGGCGTNAISFMVRSGLKGPDFIGANSDLQALNLCLAKKRIQLGVKTSGGLGCGGDPEVGRVCAEESKQELLDSVKEAELVFLMAGLGGGTGSGAIPVVAEDLGKLEQQPLTVGVVTTPFPWEDCRFPLAEKVIQELWRTCNSVIVIPNAKLCELYLDLPFLKAKEKIDEILYFAVSGVSYLIEKDGEMNVDIADVAKVMSKRGSAIMGYGEASGEKRAQLALEMAINNPLMSNVSLKGAKGVLVNITGDENVKNSEINLIKNLVREEIGPGVEFSSGFVIDSKLTESNRLIVILIATGFDQPEDLGFLADEPEPVVDEALLNELDVDDDSAFVVLDPVEEEPRRPVHFENVGSGHLAPVSPVSPVNPLAPRPLNLAANQTVNLGPKVNPGPSNQPTTRPVVEFRGRTTAPLNQIEPLNYSNLPPLSQTRTKNRARVTRENSLGVGPAYNLGDFYDLPPSLRDK